MVSKNSDVQLVGVYANCVVDMLTEERFFRKALKHVKKFLVGKF